MTGLTMWADMVRTVSPSRPSLRAVVFKEGTFYIAQCLEYDVCAQAEDVLTAVSHMELTLEIELEAQQPPRPAPKCCIDAWARCEAKITTLYSTRHRGFSLVAGLLRIGDKP